MVAQSNAQPSTESLAVHVIAEVEARSVEHGRAVVKLVPADQVVPGDSVLYTLEVRNVGATSLDAPVVTQAVPAHTTYLADSAIGPGADVSYSVDGGKSFDIPEKLVLPGPKGSMRRATAADYTHIRWQLKSLLKANSVAFVRFRARVK